MRETNSQQKDTWNHRLAIDCVLKWDIKWYKSTCPARLSPQPKIYEAKNVSFKENYLGKTRSDSLEIASEYMHILVHIL